LGFLESDSLGSDNDLSSSEEPTNNSNRSSRRSQQPSFSGWGIPRRNYSFLQSLSNENNMRSRVQDLLSRTNPGPRTHGRFRKLRESDSSSDDEDSIEF